MTTAQGPALPAQQTAAFDESRRGSRKFYSGLDDSHSAFLTATEIFGVGDRVLEIGCGVNPVASQVGSRGAEVIGIDTSAHEIDLARVADPATRFEVMNAEALQFETNSFDGVVGIAVLHELDIAAAMSEAARVLRPGGSAVFMEPLGHNAFINAYRARTPAGRERFGHPLRRGDILLAHRWFDDVDVESFHLSSLAAAPIAGWPGGPTARRALGRVDRALLRRFPRLRWQAWIAVLKLASPK